MNKKNLYSVLVIIALIGTACGSIEKENTTSVEISSTVMPASEVSIKTSSITALDVTKGQNKDVDINKSIKNIELPTAFLGYEREPAGLGWLFRYKDTNNITTVDLEDETDACCYAYGGILKVPHANYKMEQGEIIEVSDFAMNGIMPKSETLEKVENCQVPAVLLEANASSLAADIQKKYESTNYWSVFFGKEGSSYEFVLFLNQKYFSKNDIIKMAQSVQFSDIAFLEW